MRIVGRLGDEFYAKDVATGAWKSHRYEVSSKKEALAGNPNWFTVEEFVIRATEPQEFPPAPGDLGPALRVHHGVRLLRDGRCRPAFDGGVVYEAGPRPQNRHQPESTYSLRGDSPRVPADRPIFPGCRRPKSREWLSPHRLRHDDRRGEQG